MINCQVPDDVIRRLWKYLVNTCGHGLKAANGHGTDGSGRACVSPYHYKLEDGISIDQLPE